MHLIEIYEEICVESEKFFVIRIKSNLLFKCFYQNLIIWTFFCIFIFKTWTQKKRTKINKKTKKLCNIRITTYIYTNKHT